MTRLRVVEAVLWTTLAGSAGYGAFCLLQAEGTHFVAPAPAQQSAAETDGPIVGGVATNGYSAGATIPDGKVIGSFSMPALQLDVPIVEGLSHNDLLRGVGHVPGSAVAGGLGNMALAAHRDTFFRPIRNIKPGMEVLVASQDGTYRYNVDTTEVVLPEQVRVLDIGSVPQVTLITCYPFNFIGAAPKRFVVHAHLTSLVPVAGKPAS
jgi:sortase A